MKWEMEVISPLSSSTNWLIEESKSSRTTKWTAAENKIFENALAVYDKDTPDRWHKVAAMIPGKTVGDVINQYKELEADVCNIEAGLIPIPGYTTSAFTLDWANNNITFDGFKQQSYVLGGKRSSGCPPDQERKKGVPWTEEEHKLFLMGLKKYGKGDWRNISRNFVVTRTPTQVASHAQKYFIRQLSGGKDKRRASIHDITTVNLNEIRNPSPDDDAKTSSSPDQPVSMPHFSWNNQPTGGAAMAFNSGNGGNMFMSSSPYRVNPFGLKMQGNSLHRGGSVRESYTGPQSIGFQMQSGQQFPRT